jgi:hypothetical protein
MARCRRLACPLAARGLTWYLHLCCPFRDELPGHLPALLTSLGAGAAGVTVQFTRGNLIPRTQADITE